MNLINWLFILPFSILHFTSIDTPPNFKLIIFEGSDWCANCIQLEEKILSDAAFTEFSQANAIEVERIDFPQGKKQTKATEKYNAAIAEQYQFDGTFPTVILVEADGDKWIKLPTTTHKHIDHFLSFIRGKISTQE